MWHDATSTRQLARAGRDMLLAEMRLLTGGRWLLLLLAQAAWLTTWSLVQHRSADPDAPAWFYNATVVLPSLLASIALGMSLVMPERDIRHLEMSFASPGGRYLLWSFRFGALAACSAASCTLLAAGTWVFGAREITPWVAAAHAVVPALFAATLAAFLSLLLNGVAPAGLVTAAVVALNGIVLHSSEVTRFDLFVNPFDPPKGLLDPDAWVRDLAFNRLFLLACTAGFVAGALALLQRRERLL